MKPRILITGGSGLLALNWAISARGSFDVWLTMHKRLIDLSGTRSVFIDMESVDSIKKLLNEVKPELVVHAAGLTNVDQCESDPELARHVNVGLTANLAKACKGEGIALVHISTDHLFSDDESFSSEDIKPSPLNIYGQTKADAELRVLDIFPNALIVRTNFYGWGTSYRHSFSDVVINALRSNTKIRLFKDVYYSPILAEEAWVSVYDLLKKNATGIFNVVSDDRLSKYDFGLKLAAVFNLDKNLIEKGFIRDQTNLVRRPNDMSLSNQKASQLLGRKIGGVSEHLRKLKLQENDGTAQELQKL